MASEAGAQSIDGTYGAILVAVLLTGVLWGVICMQAYEFFARFTNEKLAIKSLVGIIVAMNTAHQALMSHAVYWYLITSFPTPGNLKILLWSFKDAVMIHVLIVVIVQSFFVWRIWMLSNRNKTVASGVGFVVLANFGVSLAFYCIGHTFGFWRQVASVKRLVLCRNVLAFLSDVLIAVSMVYLLRHLRTGYRRTEAIVSRIILFTLMTGSLTSVFSVLAFIFNLTMPTNLVYVALHLGMGRLYSISLLASLNSRSSMGSESGTDSYNMRSTFDAARGRSRTTDTGDSKPVAIGRAEDFAQSSSGSTSDQMEKGLAL